MITPQDKQQRNVVLDLDNTLISAEAITDFPFHEDGMAEKASNFAIHDMDNYYIVFERPHVQPFLDYLFENYNVSVWTAASKDYALYIIKHIVLKKPNRKLHHIMFSYHCDLSHNFYKSPKDLRLIWDKFRIQGYNKQNTLIIDDLEDVYRCQPVNAIMIYAFEILDDGSEHDASLKNKVKNQIKNKFQEMSVSRDEYSGKK